MRRVFFALVFLNLAYLAWAYWVTPPPTVPVNEAIERLPRLKLVEELPPSQRPDPNAPKAPDTAQACMSVGPFPDVNNSAQAASLLKERGFDPRQRAAPGEMSDGFWVFVGGMKSEADTDRMLVNLEHNGIKDALVMPATATEGRRVSLGLFSERARAERRAETVKALGIKAEVAERKLPGTLYWVDLAPLPGMNTIPLQDLFAQGVSSKIAVQPCPAATVAATPAPAAAPPAAAPA
ncbi:MAG: SPOR domain-containing protein, partial [Steroidobacteraceae bacterium]